ncbi:uncharacterized protein LOC116325048 [Oreochromis aureus]|uniref:uncharacterized protein LOC116325048 n=1 Tax=Oreochromis aureus TaxID=47969 RepID=UPI001953134E|nr:uncharacterized protein LOC116325048 [Oreochromis aureus]
MLYLWIILILLHQGSALLSVTECQLGNSVTFTCWFPDLEYSNTRVKWYKQNIGGSLKLITTLMKATEKPTFERGFSQSRFDANSTQVMSMLTIFSTVREDEALYHCAASTWSKDHWNSTYLSLSENTQSNYTVVQLPAGTDPVQPGDSVTLQCSVISSSGNSSCPDEPTRSHSQLVKCVTHGQAPSASLINVQGTPVASRIDVQGPLIEYYRDP